MTKQLSLTNLGWRHYFQQQLSLEEWENGNIVRVVGVERSCLSVIGENGKDTIGVLPSFPPICVGDWLLLSEQGELLRLLDRSSLFSRKAAGSKVSLQVIAANVATVFITCSLNDDFNLNRIERYLALAYEAGVEAVLVLTKADLCAAVEPFVEQIRTLDNTLEIIPLNALDSASVEVLRAWCHTGKTVAFLGSSGVGKSTLVNSLLGDSAQSTAAIREGDSKGRHTTTSRSLHLVEKGGLLIDTPGMRELQLANCEHGVDEAFADIVNLAEGCKFSDCQHQSEPGCAVSLAIEKGDLDERRLKNYRKLMREQALNTASLAERRESERELTRYYKSVQKQRRSEKTKS